MHTRPFKRLFLFSIVTLTILFTCAHGQETVADEIGFPHIAEVTGTDVYVRSGPGVAYYFCSKISSPSQVTVVGHKYGWIKIIPPQDSFSWISKTYVEPEAGNPQIGTVTGDSVRVYAGSPHVKARDSSSLQTKLNTGDKVRLTGEEDEDYYKISPPPDAYVWINARYLKYLRDLEQPSVPGLPTPKIEEEPAVAPQPEPEAQPEPEPIAEPQPEPEVQPEPAESPQAQPVETPQPETAAAPEPEPQPEVQPEPVVVEAEQQVEAAEPTADQISQVLDIEKQIDAELMKPLEEQTYDSYKEQLSAMIADPESVKAMTYAQYQLDRITRFELAILSEEQIKQQDSELEKVRNEIEAKRLEQIDKIPDIARFAATGTLKASHIYTEQTGEKRYLIINEVGKIVCYAIPVGTDAAINTPMYIGEKVGLIGEVVSDTSSPMTIVKYTQITEYDPADNP